MKLPVHKKLSLHFIKFVLLFFIIGSQIQVHAESEPQPPYLPAQSSQLDIFTDLIAPYLSVKTMAEINLMQEEAKKDPNLYTSELYVYQIMEQNIMRDIVFTKSQYCTSTPYDIKVNEDDEDNISESLLIDQYKVPSFNSYNRGTELSEARRASIQSEYHIFGTANGESLDGSQNGDLIRGRDGNDKIRGLGGDDFINGNVGEDDINGNDGNDVLHGGQGDDRVLGGKGNDEIHGGGGNDTLKGNDGNDSIRGLDGDDFINGNIGNDFINGNTGNDTLHGGQGNDFIHGGKDNDTIYGGMGNDIMNGDLGNDTLEGRQGSDVFFYGIGSGNDTFSDDEGEMDAILCEGKYAHIGEVIEDGNKITIKFSDTDVLIIQDKTKFEYIDCARLANGNSTYFPTWVITQWIEAIKTKPDEAVVKWKTCANSIPSKCRDELDSFACDTNRRILLEEEQLSNVRALITRIKNLNSSTLSETEDVTGNGGNLTFISTGIAQPETSGSNGSNNDASGVQTNNNASEGSLGNSVNAGAVSEYQGALSQSTTSNSASSTQEGETSSGSLSGSQNPDSSFAVRGSRSLNRKKATKKMSSKTRVKPHQITRRELQPHPTLVALVQVKILLLQSL